MNSRTFAILAATLAALLAIALWQSGTGPEESVSTGEMLLPDLRGVLNDIEAVRLTASGNRPVATLHRRDAGWIVEERSGYPADVGRLRKNLLALADAVILERKTANPDFYERLGVGDIESEASRGMRFEISTTSGNTFSVIIGDTGVSGGNSAYARRTDETQSWLVKGDFDPGTDTVDWLDAQVVDLPSRDVRQVAIEHPDGETLVVEKPAEEEFNFQVQAIPEGKELSYSTVANSIGSALAALSFENVFPLDDAAVAEMEPVTARFTMASGLVAQVRVYDFESGRRIALSFSEQAADGEPGADADTESGSEEQPGADELNARVAGWLYELPSFKSDQLVKRMTDLLKSDEEADS
jgi:hypothetical protein